MGATGATVPEEWRALFEGRGVAFADLPPAPIRPVRGFARFLLRAIPLIAVTVVAVAASYGLAVASGRWWVGLIVFVCFAWVASLLAVGFVGALKVEREDRDRRRARSLEDPIGRLLPRRGTKRAGFRDPSQYAGLFTLAPRPTLVFDVALFGVIQLDRHVRSLAPRGRLPEPEILETSSIPAGFAFFGIMLIAQSAQFWAKAVAAIAAGAPVHWTAIPGVVMVALGVYIFIRDPWVRRRLHIPRVFGADAVIGAGWIRDGHGEIWTVEDSVMLVTFAGGGMEIRLIKPSKVHTFFLPMMLGKPGTGRTKAPAGITGLRLRARAKSLAVDAAKGAAESVGIEDDGPTEVEMPTSKEPLRLLLSSWTYPEPRPDLAMRE
jgi:hypothetical protein